MLTDGKKKYGLPCTGKLCSEVTLAELMPLIEERLKSGQSVRISPKGVSMLPMLRQGRDQVILAALDRPIKKFDVVLYKRNNGNFVLHRVVKIGKSYTCIGDNQFIFEKGIDRDQIIAVVSFFYRDDKEYSTKSLTYRLYCILWHYIRFIRRVWRFLKARIKNLRRV